MTENDVRNVVFDRLLKQGWATKAWVKEIPPNQTQMMVEWTELGITRMRALHSILNELGYLGVHLNGELELLLPIIRYCIGVHGTGNSDASGNTSRIRE